MIVLKCKNCGKEFKSSRSRVKRGMGKFCSRKCYLDDRPMAEIICSSCGKKFNVQNYRRDDAKYCSHKCSNGHTRNGFKRGHPDFVSAEARKIAGIKTGRTNKGRKCPWAKPPHYRGEKNNLWRGGKSFEIYPAEWTKTLKRAIRERDKYVCQICGELQGVIAHDVHHKDYDKKNCNPTNLITLCKKCHIKTSYRRDYWIKYFSENQNSPTPAASLSLSVKSGVDQS